MSNKLLENFNKELKHRVQMRSTKQNTPEKVLLEAFKYYDTKN